MDKLNVGIWNHLKKYIEHSWNLISEYTKKNLDDKNEIKKDIK